VARSRQPL